MELKSFKMETKKPWSYVLGLDINYNALKYLLLSRTSRGLRVDGFGRYNLENGETEPVEKIRQGLKSLFEKGKGFRQAKIVLGLDSSKLVIKKESLPALSKKELLQTISFGIQEEIGKGGEVGAVVCDYETIGPDPAKPDNMQYLVMGIPEDVVNGHVQDFVSEGVVPAKIIPTVMAMTNLVKFSPEIEQKELVGILDIGSHQSMLVLVRKGKMDFFREIAIGGDDFTKSIIGTIFHEGRAIQFSEEDAVEFKLRYGYPLGFSEGMMFKGAPLTEVGAMMRPVVERLSGEIHRSIGFYKDQSIGGEVEALYLVGGGARLKHLTDVLAEKLGIPISLLPVFKDLRISGGKKHQESFRKKFLEQAICLSLAMESSPNGNLLPESYKKIHRMAFVQRTLQYAAAAAVVVIALLTLQFQNRVHALKDQVSAVEKRISRIEDRRALFAALQSQKVVLEREIADLNLRIEQDNTLVQVLRLVSHAVPNHLYFSSFEYGLEREETGRKEQSTPLDNANWIVRIYGVSQKPPNDIGIYLAQLIVELEKSKYFSKVELEYNALLSEGDEYQFVLVGYLNNKKGETS